MPERDHDRIREVFKKAIGDTRTRGNVNPIVIRDGSERVIEWYDRTLKNADNKIIGVLAIGIDITDLKKV